MLSTYPRNQPSIGTMPASYEARASEAASARLRFEASVSKLRVSAAQYRERSPTTTRAVEFNDDSLRYREWLSRIALAVTSTPSTLSENAEYAWEKRSSAGREDEQPPSASTAKQRSSIFTLTAYLPSQSLPPHRLHSVFPRRTASLRLMDVPPPRSDEQSARW
jgi:hypothetical protein